MSDDNSNVGRSEYTILVATLYADRHLSTPGLNNISLSERKTNTLELKNSISEINIFENIELPYLTGNLVVSDFVNFKDYFKIKGTEKLYLKLSIPHSDDELEFNFIITDINQGKIENGVNTFVLTFIDEYAYYASLIRKSKTYKGKPHNIIYSILNDEINAKTSDSKKFEMDKTNSFRYLDVSALKNKIQYISPDIDLLSIIYNLKERSISNDGSPLYVYKSMSKNRIYFSDLKTLLEQDPLTTKNQEIGFIYSTEGGLLKRENDDIKILHVKNFTENNDLGNTFKLARDGVLSSNISVFDTTTGMSVTNKHDMNKSLYKIFSNESNNINDGHVYDPELSIFDDPNTKIQDITTRDFSIVVNNYSYNNGNSSYLEERDPDRYKLNLEKQALKTLMYNTRYTITTPGAIFFAKTLDNSVGSIINFRYLKNLINSNQKQEETDDKSGLYMVYRIRHSFTVGKEYITDLDIVKLNDRFPKIGN